MGPLVGHTRFGAAALRLGFAALILVIVVRPRVRTWRHRIWVGVGMLGAALAGMNVLIYQAIASIPIGVAVTIELLGPLAVAVAATRRWRDLGWVALAMAMLVAAALAGLLVLGQTLAPLQLVAIAAVIVACAGAIATTRRRPFSPVAVEPPAE